MAVGRLLDGNYRSVKSKYLDDSDGEVPKSLLQLEKNSFIQIIMGVKPVSYFDEFVETWYEEGRGGTDTADSKIQLGKIKNREEV